ncbi:MAG: DinB family protein [Bryobacteraceae bacterium]
MISAETVVTPTAQQKETAAAYLAATRDELTDALKNLSPAQWSFQRAPDEWSVADVVEHLAVLEGRIHLVIARLPEAAPAEPDRNDMEVDEFIIRAVPHRTSRVQASEAVQPKRQCTPADALREFMAKRAETVQLLESGPYLRGRVLPHPILGPWDGYQWILAAAAHTARHLDQIREIKSSEAFPKSTVGSES